MSVITDVLVTFALVDEPQVAAVQAFFVKEGGEPRLSRLDCYAGGDKVMCTIVLGGAFNYFRLDDFLAHLRRQVQWEDRDAVLVLARHENDEPPGFRQIPLEGERAVAPGVVGGGERLERIEAAARVYIAARQHQDCEKQAHDCALEEAAAFDALVAAVGDAEPAPGGEPPPRR